MSLNIYISGHGGTKQNHSLFLDENEEIMFYCPPEKILYHRQAYYAWENENPKGYINTRYVARYGGDSGKSEVPNYFLWFDTSFECGVYLNNYPNQGENILPQEYFDRDDLTLSEVMNFCKRKYPDDTLIFHWLACRS